MNRSSKVFIGIIAFAAFFLITIIVASQMLQKMSIKNQHEELIIENEDLGYSVIEFYRKLNELENVSERNMADGFWYILEDEYGNASVAFFDIDEYVKLGWSKEKIDELIVRIQASQIVASDLIEFLPRSEIDPDRLKSTDIYDSKWRGDFYQNRKHLTSQQDTGSKIALAASYGLEGNYMERDKINAEICEEVGEQCHDDKVEVEINGRVIDSRGAPIEFVKVSAMSHPKTEPTQTMRNGRFSIRVMALEFDKIRIETQKNGFSNVIDDTIVVPNRSEKQVYKIQDIIMESPVGIVNFDIEEMQIINDTNNLAVLENEILRLKTNSTEYLIPADVFYNAAGKKFNGVVQILVFEFDSDNNPPLSFLDLDIFDTELGYLGDSMITYGMPYIQLSTANDEPIFVRRESPIKLKYKLDMESLKEESRDETITKLLNDSISKDQYPIDRKYLYEAGILGQIPPWWILDQKTGIWHNEGIRLLDASGNFESLFYTSLY